MLRIIVLLEDPVATKF
uniref:Uncharacterized protein n=1 Tax=Anguilla anguilla TaxID=7936 RepID=A0A0E9XWI6_ANGAN